ncbi:MAG: hypothetical protein GX996_05515 [Firmicutes bacterium]|nr:hypothetical protein [Bacillota bacterium]
MIWKEAEKLELQGKKLLEKKDYKGAEKAFARALELQEKINRRNNLALSIFLQGEAERALQIIEPFLDLDAAELQSDPFSHALGARLLAALGHEKRARRQLDRAIEYFEQAMAGLHSPKDGTSDWREHTAMIMKAAAGLGDHRQVFQLYRRWEKYHVSWENRYLAGVAAFNQGYYTRAASLWSSLKSAGEFVMGMQQVAILVDRGIVPAFKLEYDIYSAEELKTVVEKAVAGKKSEMRLAQNGMVRMMLLSTLLHPDSNETLIRDLLETLIVYGGGWGPELGYNLLRAHGISGRIKMAAAYRLVQIGALQENEPVPIVIDGEEKMLELTKVEITPEQDQEVEKLVTEARILQERGRIKEAIDLLEKFMQEGSFHPQVVLALAVFYRSFEKFDKALSLLNMLEEILPNDPIVLFNLAALWLQQKDASMARDYLERIDLRKQSEELKNKCALLEREIGIRESQDRIIPELKEIQEAMAVQEEKRRKQIENKTLPLHANLARGLKNIPVNWLDGMVVDYDLKPFPLRKDREKEVVRFLSQPHNLGEVCHNRLEDKDLRLLFYLLKRGGWARLNSVTHRFGTMDGEGFFWEEHLPDSPLACLWSHGLVMVGRTKLNGRSTKFAAVPKDLREPLMSILGIDAGEMQDDDLDKEKVFVFRVTVTDSYGRVRGYPYRTIAVPEDFTLYELGEAIIDSFGFDFDHAFGFYDNIKRWTNSVEAYELFADIHEGGDFPGVQETPAADVFRKKGKRMLFLFDYGDEWRFIVRLKKVQEAEKEKKYPSVLETYGHLEQYE